MSIANVPEAYIEKKRPRPDLFVYDFKMTEDAIKTKVNLNMHMFSFLQKGKKQVHFADTAVDVNKSQAILIKKGNCLWTELLEKEDIYYCKLFFFSQKMLREFLNKRSKVEPPRKEEIPYFIIENDEFITSYLNSLNSLANAPSIFLDNLMKTKFEEIMLYLLSKYGYNFENYLQSLISTEVSSFKKTVENNVYSNLKLEEIAFLCNMSISTFKRHFEKEFKETPGKWVSSKRLQKAHELLKLGNVKPSEIYLEFGYNNLSNFSVAFKKKFGVSPKEV